MVAAGQGKLSGEDPIEARTPTPLLLAAAVIVGLAVGALAQRAASPAVERAASPDVATVFENVRTSVVDLRVPAASPRLGAGVVVGPLEVVTARHLVLDASGPIEVRTPEGTTQEARVVASDARTDLALLAIETPLRPAEMGSAGQVRVGDTVLAVGNPFGLSHSLSVGVVGAKGRRLEAGSGPNVGFLQLSIPLNPGNSGGPIFDLDGRLVGLLTGTHTEGQGIGFAVPTDVLADVVPSLRSGTDISRAFLGIRADDTERGVVIASIVPTGPADVAGLRPGDQIIAFDDENIASTDQLYARLDRLAGGRRVDVQLYRDGALNLFTVELADWAEQPVVIAGMTLRPLAGSGGRVVAIRPRSRASRAGVQLGDVVRTVDGLPMRAPADVRTALAGGAAGRLGLDRDGQGVLIGL